jgi:haloalkane dehalogenase
MTDFCRTPDSNFDALEDYDFEPHYHEWGDLRMHYLDEGPSDGPVMLLVHGMPTWSYLYRDFIPKLASAGFRCIAPDHFGFGKSDKPTDPYWYSIARHTEVLTSLATALDLSDITLVCQDWGGPYRSCAGGDDAGTILAFGDHEYVASPPRVSLLRGDKALE